MWAAHIVFFCRVLRLLVTTNNVLCSSWWWRRYAPPKRRFLQQTYGLISQKPVFFIFSASRPLRGSVAVHDCRGRQHKPCYQ
jgi:hypothetical protein